MPYIDIKTNRTITPAQETSLKSALGAAITSPARPKAA